MENRLQWVHKRALGWSEGSSPLSPGGAGAGCRGGCEAGGGCRRRGRRSSVRPHYAPRNGKLAARVRHSLSSLVWVPPTSLQTNSTVYRACVLVTFIILLLVLPRVLHLCVSLHQHRGSAATWHTRVGVDVGASKVPMRALILWFGMHGRAAARSTVAIFYFYNI